MATPGIMNGKIVKLTVDGTAIGYLVNVKESNKNGLRETTNKDDNGLAKYAAGKFEADWSAEFMHVEGGAKGYAILFPLCKAGTEIAGVITTGVSGDVKMSATILIQSLDRDSPDNDNVKVSVSFKVSGDVTPAVI